MKTRLAPTQVDPLRQLIKDWLFTINLFFILYSLVTLFEFLLGPESGRLSTLVCKVDPWGKKVCTVKIYSLTRIYRKDFYADEYYGTLQSTNTYFIRTSSYPELALPWDNVSSADSSDSIECALSIKTSSGLIDFVPPYKNSAYCSSVNEQVRAALAGDYTAIDLRFNGYSPNIYWRLFLLVIASSLFIVQATGRYRSSRNLQRKMDGVKSQDLIIPGAESLPPSPADLNSSVKNTYPQNLGRKRFILFWWMASAAVYAFITFAGIVNVQDLHPFGPGGCFLSINDYLSLYIRYPATNLLCHAPMIIVLMMGAMLQWQLVRTEASVSGWWIAAPAMAGLPLLFGRTIGRSCADCNLIGIPSLALFSSNFLNTGKIAAFLFLLGLIEWLILQKAVQVSIVWVIFPLLEVLVATIPIGLLVAVMFAFSATMPRAIFFLPVTMAIVSAFAMLAAIFSIVPGWYLYRAISMRKSESVARPAE